MAMAPRPLSADMTTGASGNNEVKLSAWTTIKSYPDEAKAKKEYDKLLAEKTGKGYAEKKRPA